MSTKSFVKILLKYDNTFLYILGHNNVSKLLCCKRKLILHLKTFVFFIFNKTKIQCSFNCIIDFLNKFTLIHHYLQTKTMSSKL